MKAEVVKKYNLYLQKKRLRQLKAEESELFEKQILTFPTFGSATQNYTTNCRP